MSFIHILSSNRDVILDFEWRKSGEGALDYQMVTWSKDQSLRLWAPDQETQYRCGVDEEELDSESLSGESDEEACDALDQATEAFEEEGQVETEAVKKRVEFADLAVLEGRRGEKRLESPVKEHSPESTVENTLQHEFALPLPHLQLQLPQCHRVGSGETCGEGCGNNSTLKAAPSCHLPSNIPSGSHLHLPQGFHHEPDWQDSDPPQPAGHGSTTSQTKSRLLGTLPPSAGVSTGADEPGGGGGGRGHQELLSLCSGSGLPQLAFQLWSLSRQLNSVPSYFRFQVLNVVNARDDRKLI